jgi:hypothetical protein
VRCWTSPPNFRVKLTSSGRLRLPPLAAYARRSALLRRTVDLPDSYFTSM